MSERAGLSPSTKRAVLVALEGTDGVGKTTAGRRLVAALEEQGRSVTWFPNTSFGRVRRVLNELARQEGGQDRFDLFGRDFGQMVAAVYKWRQLLELEGPLSQPGHVVVVDRYVYAQFALARVMRTDNAELLRVLYRRFPRPDVTLLLDADPRTVLSRLQERGTDEHPLEFLERFRDSFRRLPEFEEFVVVDAERPRDAVFADVLRSVLPVLPPPALGVTGGRTGQSAVVVGDDARRARQ